MHTDIIGLGHAVFAVEEAVDLLKAGVCYLADVFAYLYLGDYLALIVFNGAQLVHSAENGIGFRGYEPLAHAEGVDPCALEQKLRYKALIERVRDGYLALGPAGLVEHGACLARKIGHIARVEADAALCYAKGL